MAISDDDISVQGELVRKKSLKEGVFELLHQRIVAGKYSTGEWLRQEELSLQLGVSQTPVREALDLLVSVGLAERVPYRGVRVPEWTPQEIADAYILRLILESAAVRLAASNISPEQLKILTETIEKTKGLITLDDMSTQRQLNKKFHLSLAQASGNFLMGKLYEMASNMFPDWRLYEYMFRHPELLDTSLSARIRRALRHPGGRGSSRSRPGSPPDDHSHPQPAQGADRVSRRTGRAASRQRKAGRSIIVLLNGLNGPVS